MKNVSSRISLFLSFVSKKNGKILDLSIFIGMPSESMEMSPFRLFIFNLQSLDSLNSVSLILIFWFLTSGSL